MLANKTAFVTGAYGFTGRATVLALEEAGWKVTKGIRSSSQLLGDGSISIDLADPAAILALGTNLRFDAIVHLGAHIGWSDATEAEMFTPNVLSTGCLAYLANRWKATLLFASAAIVHGVRNEKIESDSPVNPDTAYAKSKWLAEQLLAASHVDHCILRIAGVFGCGGPDHLGLNRAIAGAAKGQTPIQIGSGIALRNYVYVKDVAQAFVWALQNNLEGTHLLAGSEVMSVSAMLEAICDTFLPGRHPVLKDGQEPNSQVIEHSLHLPRTRGFREALLDIRKELHP
jgi:nucleoside-diphosphate-sugar epimerase